MDNKHNAKMLEFRQLAPTQYFTFANSAAQYNKQSRIIPKNWDDPIFYMLKYYNPSTASALKVAFYDLEDFDSNIKGVHCHIETIDIAAYAATNGIYAGLETKVDTALVIQNGLIIDALIQSGLGAAEGFTAAIKLYGVYVKTKEVKGNVLY
jgi:hypothetical protein